MHRHNMTFHKTSVFMKQPESILIRTIKDYLDEHVEKSHSIESICRQFIINREKLQFGFRELVNSTVHAYIIRQRMDRAAKQLLESDASIKSIALSIGYSKPRSFNKTFKSIYNLTPATYRRIFQMQQRQTG